MPHIPAPFSSHDYFMGIDPAMDLILNGDLRSVAEFAAHQGAEAALKYFQQLKKKYEEIDWWNVLKPEILENNINRQGYDLMGMQESESAFEVFKLNTLLFPESFNVWDSFAEWYYNMKKYEMALLYYNKSLELNPDNENAKQIIERIREEQKK